MAKMSKRDAKKRMLEIRSKAFRLAEAGYFSVKDMDAMMKIIRTRVNQLK
tara:strand:- start:2352 stop:2501 length:150 start_codon:yes stop_codon:yes gene_type:complete